MSTASDPTASPTTTAGSTMRSVTQRRYGLDPDAVLRVEEVERPRIGDTEVLVRTMAGGVDRGTVHLMTGRPYAMRLMGFGARAPKASNPGRGFAGVVVEVGRDTTGFAPGDEVYGSCDSSFAEYLRVDPARLAVKPANLTFEQAAAVPISANTALQAVRKAGLQSGQRVLILGASGGVGSYAVQIAKALGAEVTGVCSTSKVDLVRALGADHVVDYTREDVTTGESRYDVILDIGGSRRLRDLRRALTRRGVLVIVGGETDGQWLGGFDRSLRAVLLSPFVPQTLGMLVSTERADDLDALRELIESGRVTPAIDRAYPLADISAAVRHVSEGRARGKVVVTV